MSSSKAVVPSSKLGKGNYHHGELRQLLMDSALVHIAAHGTEKLSLRALAREANVSPTAPFQGLGAAASDAYGELDKLLVEVIEVMQLPYDELVLGGLIWSAIHGFASLRLNVSGQDRGQTNAPKLRPAQALIAMSEGLEANLKIMIDGLLGQSS